MCLKSKQQNPTSILRKKCNQQIEEKKLATKMKRLPFAKKLNWIRLREEVRSVQTLIVSNKNVLTLQNKNKKTQLERDGPFLKPRNFK